MEFILYETINKINGKRYVGVHKGSIDDGYLGSGSSIKLAIRKHGVESFDIRQLGVFEDAESAYGSEEFVVNRSIVENQAFYNAKEGGVGGGHNQPHSEEAKLKISNTLKGVPHSEERKAKMSASAKGRKPAHGFSEETRRRMSEAAKKRWKK